MRHRLDNSMITFPTLPSLVSYHCSTTPEDSTLSLHDALPICCRMIKQLCPAQKQLFPCPSQIGRNLGLSQYLPICDGRSEEHTSELQSRENLVCRLLLEKKK